MSPPGARAGSSAATGQPVDVLFAVLPFADLGRPAIGVSLLQAELAELGVTAAVRYLNFDLAEAVGFEPYRRIAGFPPDSLVGEWFFADLLFPEDLPSEEDYVERVLSRYDGGDGAVAGILGARAHRARFVDRCVEDIRARSPAIVGFTTTFHQTCACLAVARRLKELPSPPVVVFGGANCEGEMGAQLARSFPYVDYVCTQEGDRVFPPFAAELLAGGTGPPPPGIVCHGHDDLARRPELVADLDSLPVPVYHDYFERLGRSPLAAEVEPDVLVETSRGCWWGEKKHCTFCGLNGATMAFRAKSPDRVFDELETLWTTYGVAKIESVDNILDLRYVNTLFPRLAESDLELELFYEVKANLRRDQLVTLRDGGLTAIQPGIESFSTEVLDLMAKGCTGFQNIQLLRWCEELGIRAAWNVLYGFPGESPEEYERMADLVPLLVHLPAPASCSPFRLDRFSPFFTRGGELGIEGARPAHAYYYVFPFGRGDLARLAYYFDFDFADGREPETYTRRLSREVGRWWEAFVAEAGRPVLDARESGGGLAIRDTRPCAVAETHRLEGLAAELYRFCDQAHPLAVIRRRFAGEAGEDEIGGVLADLVDRKLMVYTDDRYLTLAVLRDRPAAERAAADLALHSVVREAPTSEPLPRPL